MEKKQDRWYIVSMESKKFNPFCNDNIPYQEYAVNGANRLEALRKGKKLLEEKFGKGKLYVFCEDALGHEKIIKDENINDGVWQTLHVSTLDKTRNGDVKYGKHRFLFYGSRDGKERIDFIDGYCNEHDINWIDFCAFGTTHFQEVLE